MIEAEYACSSIHQDDALVSQANCRLNEVAPDWRQKDA